MFWPKVSPNSLPDEQFRAITRTTKALTKFQISKLLVLAEKRGPTKTITILFCGFSFFMGFASQIVAFQGQRRPTTPKKIIPKTLRRFCCFGAYGKIFNMIVKEYVDGLKDAAVARQDNVNRKWTQIDANVDCAA